MATSSVSFANRGSTTTFLPTANTATVNYGTVLQPGDSASYPSSLFTARAYNHGGNGVAPGAIAGIVIGSVAAALLIAFLVFLLIMHRRKAAKKAKRDSRRQLLPTSHAGQSYTDGTATPEMSQRPGGGGVPAAAFATAGSAVAASQLERPSAAAADVAQKKSGLLFGGFSRGHKRSESASSMTPFLPGSPTSGYSGRTSASFDYPRLSTDMPSSGRTSAYYPNSPLAAHSEAFADAQTQQIPAARQP